MRNVVLMTGVLLLFLSAAPSAPAASSLDPTFNIGTGANGIVEQVLPLANGRILICGNFTTFNGKNHPYLARLNADGSVDDTFYGQASYWVRHMAVQPDGKIVIGGYFNGIQGAPRSLIGRVNSDGSLDPTFNPGLGATDIIAGGVDGNKDPFVFWLTIQSDGKILITGNFRNYNGASSTGIARLNPDGSRDASFNVGSGLDSWGRHILVQPNGQILLSGWFTSYNNRSFNRLVRINSDGGADTSFNPFFGDRTAIYSTALASGGKVLAGGHSLNYQGLFAREFERLNPDGSGDASFVGSANDKIQSIVTQQDGRIVVGGEFTTINGVPRTRMARLNPDGTLDDSVQASIDNFVWSVAFQSDGKLLISGGFYTVDGVSRNGVARLNLGYAPPPPPPASDPAPVLTASAVSSSQINLSWTDTGVGRTGYLIEQKIGATGTYAQIAAPSANTRAYSVTGLSAGTSYFFRMRATSAAGTSPYSNEASATTFVATSGTASASFLGADTTTHGSWRGVYGADGFNVVGDTASYPTYAAVAPMNKLDWTWQSSTPDQAALQKAAASDRIAACWYAGSGFFVDVKISDNQQHRLALYFLDWDFAGRSQTVQWSDGDTGSVLGTQTVSSFGQGVYLSWNMSGHVKITITPNGGPNAVLSGLFFGATAPQQTVATPVISPNGGSYMNAQTITLSTATAGAEIRYTTDGTDPGAGSTLYSAPFTLSSSATVKAKGFKSGLTANATASAAFTISAASPGTGSAKFAYIGADAATQGNWRSTYGADGYNVIGSSSKYPSYVQVTPAGKQDWTWTSGTTDARALVTPDGTSRIAACWYAPGGFEIGLNFVDGAAHRCALYLCDWDFAGRVEKIEVLDAGTGAVLQTLTVSNFGGGQYLVWDFRGNIIIRLTKISGPNAVVGGLFFSAPAGQL